MALFTGTGDNGTTTLFGSCDVRKTKSDPVFECLGQLDELNALTGWCAVVCIDAAHVAGRDMTELLREVQDQVFTLQAEVAGAQKLVSQEHVDELARIITAIEGELPTTQSFLVLGQTEFSARLDIARTASRKAERRLIALHESGDRVFSPISLSYANRLSSLFYALARIVNHRHGATENRPSYR